MTTPSSSPLSVAVLRLPLLAKLLGANAPVVLVAAVALVLLTRARDGDGWQLAGVLTGLATMVAMSALLMKLALQPLARLRSTLRRFASGEGGVRVRASKVADEDLLYVGDTVNDLLDGLMAERARIRVLARDTIRNADHERARIARGLHDSTAQTLAALSLEARMALQLEGGDELTAQLELIKDLAIDALEEVRVVSTTIHPRVLDDFGLAAALGWLARCAREASGLDVSLELTGDAQRIPPDAASSLFRVAEAALESAREGAARTAALQLDVQADRALLSMRDDGPVTDRAGSRFAVLRARLELSSGTLAVTPEAGRGVLVHAFAPFDPGTGREVP